MVSLIKRVVRSDLWVDGVFEERLSREPDIEVVKFSIRGAAQVARDALSAAHVYHISAAKDELPREWFASAELLTIGPLPRRPAVPPLPICSVPIATCVTPAKLLLPASVSVPPEITVVPVPMNEFVRAAP